MTTQTPDAVREAADPRVEIAARALGLHRFPGGEGRYDPPTRWPSSPRDTLSGRDGTVPLTWEFAEQCRADVRAILAALDSRAGDAGEVLSYAERLAYEERILALEMDIEALKKGEQPIYAGLTAREIGMGTYHPGDEA